MNLRNRSLFLLGLTFFVFIIIIAVVSLSVTLSGLDRLENQDMTDAVNQTRAAMSVESAKLMSTTRDWGWWDDMYQFTVDKNPEFLDHNTDPLALATIQINLFMILDEKGSLLHGQVLSADFQGSGPVPADLTTLVQSHPHIAYLSEDDPGVSGLLVTPGGLMLVASVPILSSNRTGPVHGTLIMGRYLESGPLQRITDMTGYRIILDQPQDEGTGKNLPGEQNLILVRTGDNEIIGYSAVRDLTGKDLIIGVSMGRELYRIGLANITTYLILIILWALMTGLIVLVVMDRTVLQRMGMLTDRVRSLSDNGVDVPCPVLSGNDEMAELEQTIIASRKDILIREQQLRGFINAMPGPAALFSREWKVLIVNPAFAKFQNKSMESLIGADIRSCLPSELMEKYNHFAQEAIRKKTAMHFENEINGTTLLTTCYPVLGSDGEVNELGILTFDISDRKRLENALQTLTKKIVLLNTVIFSDIQNKVYVQIGYLELARQMATDSRQRDYLMKEEVIVGEIQASLRFARQYNDLGRSPPRWQNIPDVMLFAVSHIDLGSIKRDFRMEGLEIYADSLLERVFVTLVENTILNAKGATIVRAWYTTEGDDAVIFVEDDGPGIPEDRKEEIFKKGIATGGSGNLFLSREILSITGIMIRENGISGKGARFEITVPKGLYRFSGK